MFNLVTILVGLLLLILSSVALPIFNVDMITPNVTVIIVVYAALHRDAFGALSTALLLGGAAGLMAGGLRGELLLSLLPVVGLTIWARSRFQLAPAWSTAGWCMIAALVADFTLLVLVWLFRPEMSLLPTTVRVSPLSALATGVVALPIHWTFGKIEPLLQERQERSSFLR